MSRYGDTGHCPKCGKFCSKIVATSNEGRIVKIGSVCKVHGKVDLTNQSWNYDDFCHGGG